MDSCQWTVFLGSFSLLIVLASAQVKRDKGLILTLWPDNIFGAKMRSISLMPGYDDINSNIRPSALRFINRNIDFLSVDVDYRTNRIYMYDSYLNSIAYGVNFNTSMVTDGDNPLKFDYLHRGVAGGKTQVAVDWVSHTVYWTDPVFRWVMAAPGLPEKIPMDYYKIIVKEDLQEPMGLAVDPINGYLFFSDIGEHPKIERTLLNGAERTRLLVTGLSNPHTLEWDHWDQRLYWIDFDKETIQWLTVNGNVVEHNFNRRLAGRNLFDMAVFKDVLYVSDLSLTAGLYTINKTTGYMAENKLTINTETIQAIAVFNIEAQPIPQTDHCLALNCSHLCISKKNGAECMCSEGFRLGNDLRNCVEDTGTFHTAIVYSTRNSICLVDIRTLFNFYYDPVCILYNGNAIPDISQSSKNNSNGFGNSSSSGSTRSPDGNGGMGTTAAPTGTNTSMTTPTTPVVTSNLNRDITFLDVDMENRRIFFTTNESLYQIPVEVVHGQSLMESHIVDTEGVPSGLVYDWIDDNIYWSEANTGSIKVYSLETGSVQTIISSENQPRNLVLLPFERKLMWIAKTPEGHGIRSAKINGMSVATVVKANLQNVKTLTRDTTQHNRVFWENNGILYSTDADGSDIIKIGEVKLSANVLQQYKDLLLSVSDDVDGISEILVMNKKTLSNETIGDFNNSTITDLKVMDTILQRQGPHACTFNACDQICLSVSSTVPGQLERQCRCQVGYRLVNTTKCISNPVDDNFMLVADRDLGEIFQISLDGKRVEAIVKPGDGMPTGVLYDRRSKEVIYGVEKDSFIRTVSLDGERFSTLGYINWPVSYPYRFALDETTGNLYYTTRGLYSVIAVRTPSKHQLTLIKDYITGPSGELGDIVVHPGKGYMFWSLKSYARSASLNRASMDGTQVTVIFQDGNKLRWPDGLAVDYKNDHLYFSDEYYDTISYCNFNGENRKQLTFDRNAYILDIAIDGVSLYYTSTNRMYINRVRMAKVDQTPTTIHESPGMGQLEAIDVYRSQSQNEQSKSQGCLANNGLGMCKTACFPTPTGSRCACDVGGSLSFAVPGCQPEPDCPVSDLESKGVIVVRSCSTHIRSTCPFQCNIGFELVDDNNTAVCTENGWMLKNIKPCQPVAPEIEPKPRPQSVRQGASVGAIAGGLTAALVAILVVLGAILFIYLRRRKLQMASEQAPRAVFSGGPNVAIENPGYGGFKSPEQEPQPAHEEPHYIVPSVSPVPSDRTAAPPTYEAAAAASAAENPYDNMKTVDTLTVPPEETEPEPDVDADDVVLTQDSWLREQARAKDEGFDSVA